MNKLVSSVLSTSATNVAALPVRLGVGAVMAAHGSQKLFGWFGGYGLEATAKFFGENLGFQPAMLWAFLASAGEFFGGVGLLLGVATRFFALNTVAIMGVAIWTVHRASFFADKNGMEYPLTLLLAALSLVFSGGGALSVDSFLARKK